MSRYWEDKSPWHPSGRRGRRSALGMSRVRIFICESMKSNPLTPKDRVMLKHVRKHLREVKRLELLSSRHSQPVTSVQENRGFSWTSVQNLCLRAYKTLVYLD